MKYRFSLALAMVVMLTVAPLALFASGEVEGGAAAQGGTPVEGEPYVDHIYQSVAAYEQATGNTLDGFNESPLLAARVAEGILPPVEERLPQDVVVVRPRDAIGVYGGTFQAMTVSGEIGNPIESAAQYLATFGPDTRHIVPNVIRAWELSDDATTLTLTLRRGMKWSDGDSFDMEDFEFYTTKTLSRTPTSPNGRRARTASAGRWCRWTWWIRSRFGTPSRCRRTAP